MALLKETVVRAVFKLPNIILYFILFVYKNNKLLLSCVKINRYFFHKFIIYISADN